MKPLRSLAGYQKETLLGLVALALMLVGVSVAANWALWGAGAHLRKTSQAELTTLALDLAGRLERASLNGRRPADGLTPGVTFSARILNHDLQILSLGRTLPPPLNDAPALKSLKALVRADSAAFYQFNYRREHGSDWELFHCPVYLNGKWNMLVVTRATPLLSKLEGASTLLAAVGAALFALLIVVVVALFRAVSRPYQRIHSQVAAVAPAGPGSEEPGRMNDAEGAVERLVSEYRRTIDELERKKAKLLELNERLSDRVSDVERINRYLLSSMTTGVALFDKRGGLVGINDLAIERLGCDACVGNERPEDYVGLLGDMPEVKRRVEAALVEPASDEFDVEFARDGETARSLRFSLIPLSEEDGALRELAIFIADHTQFVLAQKRLEDSRRLATLGEMAAGLAHQLRNSISAALGFGALARKRAVASEKALPPLDSLLEELQEEAALVDRFLSFARPLALQAEEVSLGAWLRKVLSGYQSQEGTRDQISLKVSEDAANYPLTIDPLLLKQAVVNLVDNALRAAAGSGDPVRVCASIEDRRAVVSVEDSGPGVSADDRERIFTPFYSGSPSGAGLGLPLARKIVDLHGGTLELTSDEGSGAKFSISLPISRDYAEPDTFDRVTVSDSA